MLCFNAPIHMRTSSPALDKALAFLTGSIRNGSIRKGVRLPPIQQLSSRAGVSYVTMWKAVNVLVEKQILTGFHARHIALRDHQRSKSPNTVPVKRQSHHLQNNLERDIFNLHFKPGRPLPSLKELQARYGVSYRTLKRNLEIFIDRGVLLKEKGTYLVSSYRASPGLNKVVLFVDKEITTLNWRPREFLYHLENHCTRAGVILDVALCMADKDGAVKTVYPFSRKNYTIRQDSHVIGYIYMVNDSINHGTVLRKLARLKRPVAIGIQDDKAGLLHEEITTKAGVKKFVLGISSQPADRAARYLLELGHRRIAYVSPFSNSDWSTHRREVLQRMYAKAGTGYRVTPFTTSPRQYRDVKDPRMKTKIALLNRFYRGWIKRIPPEFFYEYHPVVAQMAGGGHSEEGLRRNALFSLFSRALEHKEITAWVCSEDSTAMAAQDFLAEHNVAVPDRLSLLALDDSMYACIKRISCYNPNLEALACAMFNYITGSHRSLRAYRRKKVEVRGSIHERMTCAPAEKPFG